MGGEQIRHDRVERQLNEWDRLLDDYQAKMTAWKVKADTLEAEARADAFNKITSLEEKIQGVRQKVESARAGHECEGHTRTEALNEVKAGASSVWESLKTGIDQAWTELKSTFDQSSSKPK